MTRCPFAWMSSVCGSGLIWMTQIVVVVVVLYQFYLYCSNISEFKRETSKKFDATTLNELRTPHPSASQNVVTVYAPGIGAAHHQAAKYAGSSGVPTSVSETVGSKPTVTKIDIAPALIYNVYERRTDDVVYVKSGSLGDYLTMVPRLPQIVSDFSYGMINPPNWFVLPYKWDFAGDQTSKTYAETVEKCAEANPDKKIVLFGSSNGASTICAALPKLSQTVLGRVALVVLETPYDELEHVVAKRYGKKWLVDALPWFTRYKRDQPTPIQGVKKLPNNVPVAFVTVKGDTHVDNSCTKALITALKTARSALKDDRVHHLELVGGAGHYDASINNVADARDYKRFMDELYDKYVV